MAGLTVDQLSASFDARLDNNAQNLILFSGSFEQKLIPISSSNVNLIQDVSELTADLSDLSSSVRMQSASFNSRINVLKTSSGGLEAATFNSYTSSTNTKLSNLESYTSSYATTGSNTFSGAQTINSDLTVAGKITARLYHTELVSSSIVYESGSTKFGNTSDDVHAFTGSVSITGSLNANHIHISSGSNTELLISNTGVGSQYRIQAGATGHLAIRDINTNSTILRIGTGSVDFLDSIEVSNNITASFGKFIDVNLLGDLTASNFTGRAASIAVWGASNSLTSSNHINLTNGNQTLAIGTLGYTEGNPEALLITNIQDSFNIVTIKATQDDYAQVNVINQSAGVSASTDLVLTADNGTELNMYMNVGINSSNYTKGEVGFANDGYVINAGEDLYIGSLSTGSHGHVHLFGGGHWQSSSISIYQDGKIGINTDKLNQLADTIPTAGYAVEISGSVKFNNSLNVTGSVYVSELVQATTIQGTGSMYLQPDVNDSRKLQIYNTGASDTHVKASGGLTFLGDDTNYVKIDDSLQTITIDSTNGVNIDTSVNITGSLYLSSSYYAISSPAGQAISIGDASIYTKKDGYNNGFIIIEGQEARLKATGVVLETNGNGVEIIGNTKLTGSLTVSSSNAVDVNVIGTLNVTGSLMVSSSNDINVYGPKITITQLNSNFDTQFELKKANIAEGGYYQFNMTNYGANGTWFTNGDKPIKILTDGVTTFGGNFGATGSVNIFGQLLNGNSTTASGDYSHAEGNGTTAIGNNSHAEGFYTTASAFASHTEGYYSNVLVGAQAGHAEGYSTLVSGQFAHAEGQSTQATGETSHAEGRDTIASGINSHAEGYKTLASGLNAHSEGSNTTASAAVAHSEGIDTKAVGQGSHAEGTGSWAGGNYSHAEGYGTRANENYELAIGTFNAETYNGSLFVIGNGISDSNRSNIVSVTSDNLKIGGALILDPIGAPSSPASGSLYFSSADSHFYGWNGVQWKQLDN